jgi:hypothetical protein
VENGEEEWVLDTREVGTDDEDGDREKAKSDDEAVWTVRTLERNMATFMGLIGDATP